MAIIREFEAGIRIERPVNVAFDFVADYRNVARVLEGVTRWEPLDRRTRGAGTHWDVEMRTLGFPLHNRLLIDRWDAPQAIAWRSESGLIEQRGSWTFSPAGDATDVTLRIAYQPPGAALGNLLAGRADSLVRERLERALARMKRLLEAEAPAAG